MAAVESVVGILPQDYGADGGWRRKPERGEYLAFAGVDSPALLPELFDPGQRVEKGRLLQSVSPAFWKFLHNCLICR